MGNALRANSRYRTCIRIVAPGRDFRYAAKHPLDMAEVLSRHGYWVEVVCPMPSDVVALHNDRGFKLARVRPLLSPLVRSLESKERLFITALHSLGETEATIGVDPSGFVVAHLLKRLGRTRKLIYYAMELTLPEERPEQQTVRYLADHIHDADLVVITGEHRATVMRERLKLPTLPMVIHNSFVAPKVLPEPALRSFLVAKGFVPARHLVLFIGRLFWQHALEDVIESMVDWTADTGLVLAGYGDGGYVRELSRLAESKGLAERVYHLGSTPPGSDNVLSLMREASIGLVLKRYKGGIMNDVYYTPTKLFEYAAAGLPVICSDQESLKFVQREGWGICVDIDQPGAIAGAVNDILQDAATRDQMAERAQRRFVKQYSMEREMTPLLSQLAEWHTCSGVGSV